MYKHCAAKLALRFSLIKADPTTEEHSIVLDMHDESRNKEYNDGTEPIVCCDVLVGYIMIEWDSS